MRPMPIIRSRTGCFTCRRRKKKCDEKKPVCSGCKRNKLECHWPEPTNNTNNSSSSSSQPRTSKASASVAPDSASAGIHRPVQVTTERRSFSQPLQHRRQQTELESDHEPEAEPDPEDQPTIVVFASSHPGLLQNGPGFTINGGIPMPMSMLPQQGHHSYELLSYYLARTANSMGNGSTDVNPFIAKLIPLAFSKPLVLQLILAQSAAHRQASAEPLPTDEVAQRYYTDSLRMFRNVVDEYVSGNAENTLVLTVGSLIMCLTEVAKGDIHGTIFDHLTASKSLVSTLLTGGQTEPYGDLPDFLIEYYMHMAATSMISIDPQYNSQSLLSPDIEFRARELVARKYVGQLCGCWLELLILISQIFHLGQSMLAVVDGQTVPPSPDSIVNFAFLQSQVMGFFPDPSVSPYSRLAGLVWKQAVLLYLWSVLGTPQPQASNSVHKALMDSAVAEAITLLDQFPASERINTSLCWPLAVIGCCTSDPIVQQVLRDRLQTMLDTIGLGNMRQTLVLLEHIWQEPLDQVSPWTLCRAMREHQIWISFA
ncbi:uncharacterized protein NECHADRAFT_103670 [Fusarium vanettenii 77-13-4]|uniref:Zn(2)-C6 fungal-type domain-containing protein n=1 Tax=Fusarium vanettenii (strain ATCC MYA-4622 / CBS 123669 / FGSC 9596 / NRRL 45880 / 77-13-4) TaxID=660122 RepID=C7YLG9_FUSV7|nr:uncharacterized protein NECHADRAFT_103670 [Fusarium vanettenii 77-13-4]EEU46783.1 hypothetical protein NECHADRAFT_103670 [Fusarium vanettenii 77-13-4]